MQRSITTFSGPKVRPLSRLLSTMARSSQEMTSQHRSQRFCQTPEDTASPAIPAMFRLFILLSLCACIQGRCPGQGENVCSSCVVATAVCGGRCIGNSSYARNYATQICLGHEYAIRNADLSYNDLEYLDCSASSLKLKELNISHNNITISDCESWENHCYFAFRHLENIDISFNRVSNICNASVFPLRKLKCINMSHNSIETTFNLPFIASATILQRLDLSYNEITFINRTFVANNHGLEYINLSHNKIYIIDQSIALTMFSKIKNTDLSYNRISKFHFVSYETFSEINQTLINLVSNEISQITLWRVWHNDEQPVCCHECIQSGCFSSRFIFLDTTKNHSLLKMIPENLNYTEFSKLNVCQGKNDTSILNGDICTKDDFKVSLDIRGNSNNVFSDWQSFACDQKVNKVFIVWNAIGDIENRLEKYRATDGKYMCADKLKLNETPVSEITLLPQTTRETKEYQDFNLKRDPSRALVTPSSSHINVLILSCIILIVVISIFGTIAIMKMSRIATLMANAKEQRKSSQGGLPSQSRNSDSPLSLAGKSKKNIDENTSLYAEIPCGKSKDTNRSIPCTPQDSSLSIYDMPNELQCIKPMIYQDPKNVGNSAIDVDFISFMKCHDTNKQEKCNDNVLFQKDTVFETISIENKNYQSVREFPADTIYSSKLYEEFKGGEYSNIQKS